MKTPFYLLFLCCLVISTACGRKKLAPNEGVIHKVIEGNGNTALADAKFQLKYLLGAEEEMNEELLTASIRILEKRLKQADFLESEYQVERQGSDILLRLHTDQPVESDFIAYLVSSRCELEMNEVYLEAEIMPLLGQADTLLQRKMGLPIHYSDKGFQEKELDKHPLLGKVGLEFPYNGVIGMGNKASLEEMATLLNTDEFGAIFPDDCRFVVSKSPMNITGMNGEELYSMYATKINPLINWNDHITEAGLSVSMHGDELIDIKMDEAGAKEWYRVTRKNIDRPIAVIIDGVVYTAPIVRSAIAGGRSQISGNFTKTELKGLVGGLRGGCLPVELEFKEMVTE